MTLSGYKILVVSGEKRTADFLHAALVSVNCGCIYARSAEEAVDLAMTEAPNAILVEFPLADCSGKEAESAACLALCSLARPAFLIAGEPDAERAIEAFEAGFSDYLVKPLEAGVLLAKIRHHMTIETARLERERRIEDVAHNSSVVHRSVGGAIHDLSNFLLSIRGLSEILAERSNCHNDPGTRELATAILSASEQGLKRVEAALDSAVMGRDSTGFTRGMHGVGQLLDEAIGNLSGWALRKQIEFKMSAVEPALMISCDRGKLVRAVENLLSNAVKYSPSGAVVEVEAGVTGEGLAIAIRDEGPGFNSSDTEPFFEDFHRRTIDVARMEGSHGLGLAICQEIVVAHQGRIECRKLSPRGSEFIINLPVGKDAA